MAVRYYPVCHHHFLFNVLSVGTVACSAASWERVGLSRSTAGPTSPSHCLAGTSAGGHSSSLKYEWSRQVGAQFPSSVKLGCFELWMGTCCCPRKTCLLRKLNSGWLNAFGYFLSFVKVIIQTIFSASCTRNIPIETSSNFQWPFFTFVSWSIRLIHRAIN